MFERIRRGELIVARPADIENQPYGFDAWRKTPKGDSYLEKRGLLSMQGAPKIQFKALAAIRPGSDTAVGIVVNDPSNLLDTFEQAWDWRLLLL